LEENKKDFDLKAELKSLGMTQKDFAEKTGFSVSTVSVWNSQKKISKVGRNFLNTLSELRNKTIQLEETQKLLNLNKNY
jgi:transcriptional regulator with XRE-family HTH domain